MIAATLSLIRHASQIMLVKTTDVIWVDGTFRLSCRFCFCPGGTVHRGGFPQGLFVVVEDVGLGCADSRINSYSPVRGISREKLSDKPAAAEGSQETAPLRFKT